MSEGWLRGQRAHAKIRAKVETRTMAARHLLRKRLGFFADLEPTLDCCHEEEYAFRACKKIIHFLHCNNHKHHCLELSVSKYSQSTGRRKAAGRRRSHPWLALGREAEERASERARRDEAPLSPSKPIPSPATTTAETTTPHNLLLRHHYTTLLLFTTLTSPHHRRQPLSSPGPPSSPTSRSSLC